MKDQKEVIVNLSFYNKSTRPTIFIINRLSGPQFGDQCLAYLYKIFNPIQIIDLIDEGLVILDLFLEVKNLQVVIAGGDGTIASISDHIIEKKPKDNEIKIIPMPLGTGNDMSRTCGWGSEVSSKQTLINFLTQLESNNALTYIDRWKVTIEVFEKQLDVGNGKKTIDYMYLYMGLGLDAKCVYFFNYYRKKFPQMFKSRIGNKFIYTNIGASDLPPFLKTHNFKRNVSIYANNSETKLPLPEPECIIFQNVDYWGGGCHDLWDNHSADNPEIDTPSNFDHSNSKKSENRVRLDSFNEGDLIRDRFKKRERIMSLDVENLESSNDFVKQNHSDKKLEVVGFRSSLHIGRTHINMDKPNRIGQASCYCIEGKTDKNSLYMHIDGEARKIKGAYRIKVRHADQVPFGTC